MHLLKSLFRPVRGTLAVAVITSLVAGALNMLLVALINRALTSASDSAQLGLQFAALSLMVLGARWLADSLFAVLGQGSLARLRTWLGSLVARASFRTLETEGSARILAALADDVSAVAQFMSMLPGVLMHLAVILGCLAYLAVLSWQIFTLIVGLVALGSLAFYAAEKFVLRYLTRARAAEDEVFDNFRSLFDGAKELRLHEPRARAFMEELGQSVEQVRKWNLAGLKLSVMASSVGAFLFFAVIGLVLFVLGSVHHVERAVLSGYALVFLYMVLPLESLLGALPRIQQVRVALEHLNAFSTRLGEPMGAQLLAAVPEPDPRVPMAFESLELRGVAHRYRRDEEGVFELGPIDLQLQRGEVLFIAGGNGSGKTTLAKLLVGLYEPESGEILLDGQRVTDATRAHHRAHFSAIFSDFHLFDRLWGIDPARSSALAPALLEELRIAHKVSIDAGRFSTTALSQGQRKRLALLVAQLEDRPIVVFDEWASDQDPVFRELFYRHILPELRARGKAVLAITHDDRYFDAADRCIKLELGKITSVWPEHTAAHATSVHSIIHPLQEKRT